MTGRHITALLIVAMLAAGCAKVRESRINPFNWFGRAERTTVVTSPARDPRPLVTQVIELKVEKAPGGAIVRATGLPPRQGYWNGELVPLSGEPGVLNFEFRVAAPLDQTLVSTQRSREVVVAVFVSEQTLSGVRSVRVSGIGNALAVRR